MPRRGGGVMAVLHGTFSPSPSAACACGSGIRAASSVPSAGDRPVALAGSTLAIEQAAPLGVVLLHRLPGLLLGAWPGGVRHG